MNTTRSKKGFTITELVIVIVVIAILAAVLIPTFTSLINRANESVDIQLVRQMNTILKTEEAANGKPANVEMVKIILTENGIVDPSPALADSAFAWDREANVIILINKTTQKGVFPKEYKDVEYKSTWDIFAGTVNFNMEELGANIDEALANAKFGYTIVLSSDQKINSTLPKNVDIDLNGKTLEISNGAMQKNSKVVLTNGNVISGQISVTENATLTLNKVNLTSTASYAIFPGKYVANIDLIDSTIIARCPIGTNYSDDLSKNVVINMRGTTFGSAEKPCQVGILMNTNGNIRLFDCAIYATEKCVYNRAGNVYIEKSTMYYQPTGDYVDTYLGNEGTGYPAPGGYKSWHWLGGSSGVNAPIVVGDFRAKHYSFDANCTLVNVTVNSTNATYPDVYLSQEKYDVIDKNTKVKSPGTVSVKTNLTCDDTIKWAVNPGKNDAFVALATGEYADYANYAGYEYSGSGHNGTALLYIDNVFVNGVEKDAGATNMN